MTGVLIALVAGIAVGLLLRRREALIVFSERITTGAIYLLLWLLGLSVGANDTVIRNLGNLGIQSFTLCSGGIVGSVLVSLLVYTAFFRKEQQ